MAAVINRRLFSRSTLALPGLGLLLLSACAGQGDINRTQPDKIDKSIFLNADGSARTFYYRKTTVGVPPTSAYAFEGIMGDLMKVRFDIREKFLVGYRAYDYAPGSQNASTGGTNNQDTPMLMFAVTGQFDVKREYNPGTGEQTNVISENTTDRPWNERQYMRVDWSKNLVDTPADSMAVDPLNSFFYAQTLPTGFSVGEGDQALINPDRPIISHDYVDFATKELRTPDLDACSKMFDPLINDGGIFNCGQAEITYRNALLPVPEEKYIPLSYPDRQTLLGPDKKPLMFAYDPTPTASAPNGQYIECTADMLAAAGLSGDDCFQEKVDRFAKFGYFRTIRQTYDRQVGATEQGREYLINRWNIWENGVEHDAAGNPIRDTDGNLVPMPYANRKTRKITYYLNPQFPADPDLRASAAKVIGDWNQAMKETVAGLLFTEKNPGQSLSMANLKAAATAMPDDIFELKPNGCELGNVQTFMDAHADVVQMVKSRVKSSTLDLSNLTATNLLQACSALSAVTENLADDDARKFVWQRNGDLRYSFLHWVDRPQPDGPLGYGPSSQDPETGEIISASAYIYGASLDTYAQFAVDSVRMANGDLSPDDLLSGKTISDVLAETRSNRLARQAEKLSDANQAAAVAKLRSLGTQTDRLVKVAAGIDDQAIARIRGTTLEKLLLNDDVLPGLIPGYRPGDTPPANAFDQAMNQPWFSSQAREARKARFQTLAQTGGCLYMAEFADDAILGTALSLDQKKITNPEDMFKYLRASIFRGLADHEVGHTMGLRHNFSASTDALNYDDQYWKLYTNAALSPLEKEQQNLSELAYASVMDYGARFNSDVEGLGKYDTAAIRFGYGELVDLMPMAKQNVWTGLASNIIYNDYSKLPQMLGASATDTTTMDTAATTVASYNDEIASLFTNTVMPERPYKFCSDEFEGNFDCKTWDRGANQQEIVGNTEDLFRNYYVFNAYKRGRTTWQIESYENRIAERYFNRYAEAFQFFFFYGDQLKDTDFGKDLLLGAIQSLNALGAVLQTPQPGMHCTTAYSPTVLTIPISPSDCLSSDPTANPTLNLPDAKPYYIAFSDDYYYRITRAGSLYEKLMALFTLTSTEARFYRIDSFADSSRYSINYFQIFRDEVVKLLSGVIRNDPTGYAATMNGNNIQPTPVVDLSTYGVLGAPTPAYAQPNALRVETPVNKTIRYWTLLLALARLGSTWDAALDFQNFLAISVKGADDDFTVASTTPVKEFTHPVTGVIYRAPSYTTPNNIGADILDELAVITGTSGVAGTIPMKYGVNVINNTVVALPTWYAAKAALAQAAAGTDQKAYTDAQATFTLVDQVLAYRIDLISDIRTFRKQLMLLNGVIQ